MRLEIVKWNPINDEFGEIRASVYIKPTLEFLEFINKNSGNGNRSYMVTLSGTKHPIYDGMPYLGIVDASSDVANCRQNFYRSTGLYIVMLSVRWFGYPEKNGSIEFLEGIITDTYGTQSLKDTPNVIKAVPLIQPIVEMKKENDNIENYQASVESRNKYSDENNKYSDENNKYSDENNKYSSENNKYSDKNNENNKYEIKSENTSENKNNYTLYLYIILFLIVLVYVASSFSHFSNDK